MPAPNPPPQLSAQCDHMTLPPPTTPLDEDTLDSVSQVQNTNVDRMARKRKAGAVQQFSPATTVTVNKQQQLPSLTVDGGSKSSTDGGSSVVTRAMARKQRPTSNCPKAAGDNTTKKETESLPARPRRTKKLVDYNETRLAKAAQTKVAEKAVSEVVQKSSTEKAIAESPLAKRSRPQIPDGSTISGDAVVSNEFASTNGSSSSSSHSTRSSRRGLATVSYAEPSLKVKMRRN